MQNLKVDIIYYQSPSDFEMEFNLGSSCHMRTLSDKTTDKKSFIKALVRGVARSRVIMCCGPLFAEDGLIKIVSKAIGTGTSRCDNKIYGINSDEPIDIISGSTPLVTPDGYFGGCIIESGPQTIILLTENRTFRKSIMKNLIHPYMSEISYVFPNATTESVADSPESEAYDTAVSENEIYLTEKDEEYDKDVVEDESSKLSVDTESDEYNMDFVMSGSDEEEPDTEPEVALESDTYMDIYATSKTEDEPTQDIEETYTSSEEDGLFISEKVQDVLEQKQKKQDTMRAMDVTITALVVLLLLAVLALVYLLVLRPVSMGVGVGDYIKEIFGIVSSSTLV
ncbi:MAG: hypothetical protein IJN56_08760 [Clostridia bacterium]|nr:hypothetical protein [Clostridia bacterium]